MEASWFIEQIKFEITGGVLESELDDDGYKRIIDMTLQEVNRYYDETRFITVPASQCIDLEQYPDINTVSRIYRKNGFGTSAEETTSFSDPTQVQLFALGNSYYSNRYASNLIAYSTMQATLSTTSTDIYALLYAIIGIKSTRNCISVHLVRFHAKEREIFVTGITIVPV